MLVQLLAGMAFAGGYYYSDSGIVATGRGGAFVAGANTQFAQHYNPAGLIRIERPTVNVGASFVQQNVGFRRLGADGDPEAFFPEVENQASPFVIPQGGFATPIGEDFALAVGFYSPFAPSSLYDEEGPQRYSIKDTLIYQFSVGPSLAWQPIPELTVGIGLQWQYLQVGQAVDITLNGNDDPSGDIAVEARVVDAFTPNANFGVLLEPMPEVSIGASVQPGSSFRARGEGTLDFTGNTFETLGFIDPARYTDDDVSLSIRLPWVLRAGVAVRPHESLEIEGAVVWQGWSSLGDLLVEDIDITVASDLLPKDQRQVAEEIALPAGFDDTLSLRLGAEWKAAKVLSLRAGGFYEDRSLTPQNVSVALFDTRKFQIGGGASVFLLDEALRFDVAAAYLGFQNLQIRDSTVTQIDAGVIPNVETQVVGNGDLRGNGWILGLQAQLGFGKRRTDD
ncbi:MAG: outer membrane protein transport protein [Myxococcota bacterium]